MYSLQVKKMHPDAILPTVAHVGEDLGYDLYALENTEIIVGKSVLVRTGISARATFNSNLMPSYKQNVGLVIKDRSSMANKGVYTHAGVIDAGYTDEIKVMLSFEPPFEAYYVSSSPTITIVQGQKFAQMIPMEVLTGPILEVDELPRAHRGANGFGSTGS